MCFEAAGHVAIEFQGDGAVLGAHQHRAVVLRGKKSEATWKNFVSTLAIYE